MSDTPPQSPSPANANLASTQPDSATAVAQRGMLSQTRLLDPPNKPGETASLDRYSILRQIGEGGMGLVFLARHPVTGSALAIKVIRPQLLEDPRSVHRFLTEARHMSRLSHPNLLKVMDVSDRAAGPYYVMPFMERGSLAKLLGPGKPLELAVVMQIAREIAGALAYAHEKGIIHRDLKPANVLLDEGGHACLSDFGLVRTVFNDSIVDVRLSQCEGTAAYMSPAVAKGAAEDTRCDIYAFGAMLYEMLSGHLPYEGRSSREVIEKVLAGPPEPILQRNPQAHPGLTAIAAGAMGRELRDRYSSMADVVADLERVEKGSPPLGPHGSAPAGQSSAGSQTAGTIGGSVHATLPELSSPNNAASDPATSPSAPAAAHRKSFSIQANLRSVGCSLTIAMGLLITVGGGIFIAKLYSTNHPRQDFARTPAPAANPKPGATGETAFPRPDPTETLPFPIPAPPPYSHGITGMGAAADPIRRLRESLGTHDLLNAHNHAPAFFVHLATADGKKEYVEGEAIGFVISATRRCYLTLIAQDGEGKVTLLLPNHWQPAPVLATGEMMTIPGNINTYRFPITAQRGITLVRVIATTEPLKLLPGPENAKGFRDLPHGAKAIGLGQEIAAPRDHVPPATAASPKLLSELLPDTQWATAELLITIKPRPEPPPGDGM